MHLVYLLITLLAAAANGYAACLNFVRAASVRSVADRLHVSHAWMIPFGTLLAAGAIGLLVGIAVPVLGKAAAIGLILYFLCALRAHMRARDSHVGAAVSFLVLSVAALIANIAYHTQG